MFMQCIASLIFCLFHFVVRLGTFQVRDLCDISQISQNINFCILSQGWYSYNLFNLCDMSHFVHISTLSFFHFQGVVATFSTFKVWPTCNISHMSQSYKLITSAISGFSTMEPIVARMEKLGEMCNVPESDKFLI